MELLGITGVEDLLQENVKETFESLRDAGIKIWMLTGDKVETAMAIAKSSKLLLEGEKCMVFSGCSRINQISQRFQKMRNESYDSLVIDDKSLSIIFQEDHKFIQKIFIEISKNLSTVIACRCTPLQKANLVDALQRYAKKSVCCIGDGGNDVSVIRGAHV